MKTLPESTAWYSADYDELIDSFEVERLVEVSSDDYQGDTLLLLRRGEEFGFLTFGWGSCSGCDALQACDSAAEATELRDELWAKVEWKSRDEMRTYLAEKDWAGQFYTTTTDTARFVAEARAALAS